MTIDRARDLLGTSARGLTDDDVRRLNGTARELAELILAAWRSAPRRAMAGGALGSPHA